MQGSTVNCIPSVASLQQETLQVRYGAGRRPEHCQGEPSKPAAWSLSHLRKFL